MASSPNNPVLILTGPPGVGKTTVAAILAERSDRAVHLEADLFFRFIRAGHVEPWRPESHEQNDVVMRIVAGAAGYAAAGYFTIVDGIAIPGWFFEPLRDREGAPSVDPTVIERLWREFADLGDLERNVIDLDGESPEQTADLLEARLGDRSLAV